jgi:hypothetical protein
MEDAAPHPDEFSNAFEAAFAELQVRIETACLAKADWPTGVAAGIRAALTFATRNPISARVLTTDALAAGKPGFARYERLISYLGDLLAPGRDAHPGADRLPEETERALAGGIGMLVAQRLDMGRHAELSSLAPQVTQFALTPYLGIDEAQRVAAELSG